MEVKMSKEWFWYLGYFMVGLSMLILGLAVPDNNRLALFAYPFISVGKGLRALLLANLTGAIFGYIFYILLGISPLIIGLAMFFRKKRITLVDVVFLLLISTFLFVANYFFINPDLFSNSLNELIISSSLFDYGMMITESGLTFIFYAMVIIYLALRAYLSKSISYVQSHLATLFLVFLICYIYLYSNLGDLMVLINTQGQAIEITQAVETVLTSVLMSIILIKTSELVSLTSDDKMNKRIIGLSKLISLLALIMLIETLAIDSLSNVLYLCLGKNCQNITYRFSFPLLEILFTFIFLGLSRYFALAQRVKEENDLTV